MTGTVSSTLVSNSAAAHSEGLEPSVIGRLFKQSAFVNSTPEVLIPSTCASDYGNWPLRLPFAHHTALYSRRASAVAKMENDHEPYDSA